MAVSIKKVQGEATITKTEKSTDGSLNEVSESEAVEGWDLLKGEPAVVGVEMAALIPTGNFANVRFAVSLKMPCGTDIKAINETYDGVLEWVNDRLEKLVTEVKEQ